MIQVAKAVTKQEGRTFVGVLGFCMSFFEFESAACSKKKDKQNPSIPTNVWHFLFCEGFTYQKNSFYQLTQDTMMHGFSAIYLNRTNFAANFSEIRG